MKETYDKIYKSLDYGPIASARGLTAAGHVRIKFPPQKTLCVGAGNAYEAVHLADNGYDVTVIDYIKAPVNNPKFRQVVGDARSLPFKDDEFSLVVCCECIEHIPEKDIDSFMLELKRVGLYFYFTIDDADDPPYHSHLCIHEPIWWLEKFGAWGFTGEMFKPMKFSRYVGNMVVDQTYMNQHGFNFYGNKILQK